MIRDDPAPRALGEMRRERCDLTIFTKGATMEREILLHNRMFPDRPIYYDYDLDVLVRYDRKTKRVIETCATETMRWLHEGGK